MRNPARSPDLSSFQEETLIFTWFAFKILNNKNSLDRTIHKMLNMFMTRIILNNSALTKGRVLLLVLLAMVISSCAPKASDAPVRPEPVISREKPFGPTISLEQFIGMTLGRQYSSLEQLFEIPQDNPDHRLIMISREKPVLILDTGVTAYTGDDGFLAAGYADGNIRVWSDLPCPMVALPDKEPVRRLWHGRGSPYLSAAGDSNPSRVSIYDLNRCARVADIDAQGPVENVAVSSQGSHLALVDAGRRLWTGNLQGSLEQQATLRFDPLDMAFSPREGILMLADQAGWLVLWNTPDYSGLEQSLIPGGPFEKADFMGPELVFWGSRDTPAPVVWNIPGGEILQASPETGSFTLENGILYYTLYEERQIKKVHMIGPGFSVLADKKNMILKFQDLDGKTRHYDAVTGLETQSSFSSAQGEALDVSLSGGFTWAGIDYSLADPVIISSQWVLWCRYIPGRGYYLWWLPNTGLEYLDFKSELPVRENIRGEIPPAWVGLD